MHFTNSLWKRYGENRSKGEWLVWICVGVKGGLWKGGACVSVKRLWDYRYVYMDEQLVWRQWKKGWFVAPSNYSMDGWCGCKCWIVMWLCVFTSIPGQRRWSESKCWGRGPWGREMRWGILFDTTATPSSGYARQMVSSCKVWNIFTWAVLFTVSVVEIIAEREVRQGIMQCGLGIWVQVQSVVLWNALLYHM